MVTCLLFCAAFIDSINKYLITFKLIVYMYVMRMLLIVISLREGHTSETCVLVLYAYNYPIHYMYCVLCIMSSA